MTSLRKFATVMIAVTPLFLAACGDGWETRAYSGVPYDGDRTAGRGVEYVRASLMPARTVNTESMLEKRETETVGAITSEDKVAPPPAPVEQPPIKDADEVFNKKVSK